MKIASITIYCNEMFRLDSWAAYAEEYKNEIYKHIIVNNGDERDTQLLESKFPDSIILFSDSKALTTSYNLGIKKALEDKNTDSIMLIGNDIRLAEGNATTLYTFLFSDKKYGMVAPVLLKKDSDIIEAYGCSINQSNLKFKHLHVGELLSDVDIEIQISDSVPGGMNLALREFYEKLGLQDEKLFMYSDEIDTGIKAKKYGFLIASTINCIAWHQHVDLSIFQIRSPLAGFLKSRNSIYLAHKHRNIITVLRTFSTWFFEAIKINLSAWVKNKSIDHKKYSFNFLLGTMAGLFNIVKIPKRLL